MRAKQDQMEPVGFFLRLSPDQRAVWEDAARRQGFATLAKFVRAAVDQAADEGLKITAEDRRAIGNVREQVRRIGVNLNMVAAALNALADAPELAERWRAKLIRTEEELAGEIRAAVAGGKPFGEDGWRVDGFGCHVHWTQPRADRFRRIAPISVAVGIPQQQKQIRPVCRGVCCGPHRSRRTAHPAAPR